MADKYNTTPLVDFCAAELVKTLNKVTCLRVLELGHLCNRQDLKDKVRHI